MKKLSSTTEQERLSPTELTKEILADKAEAARIRLSIEMGSEKNHAKYRDLRRKIARMSTTLTNALATSKETERKTSQVHEKSVQRTSSRSKKK